MTIDPNITKGGGGYGALPLQISELTSWLPWVRRPRLHSDKFSKIPCRRLGQRLYPVRADNQSAWLTLQAALREVNRGCAEGVGVVVPAGLCALDLDDVVVDGVLQGTAVALVELAGTYVELSPSGTGLHVWCTCGPDTPTRRAADLELLATGQFVTVTGRPISAISTLMSLPEHLVPHVSRAPTLSKEVAVDPPSIGALVRALQKSPKLRSLYLDGDFGAYGYKSQSEADLGLCQLLIRVVGPDAGEIDRLFRASRLYRPKWQSESYGQRTIQVALATAK
jgi:putative DNA primase/helicase